MPDYLSKSQISAELAARGIGGRIQINNILDGLAELAAEEIEAGNDFQVPGIVKIAWSYRAPQTKGARWKKGDEVTGFGGIANVKTEDSPPVKPAVKLRAALRGRVGKSRVSATEMSAFLKSKAGKAVVARKSA